MRVYLDVCCLNRPFDDLSQKRVYAEAEAVDVFLTTDDRLLRRANRIHLGIKVANPYAWIKEVCGVEWRSGD